jgi:hypothetical protein
MTVVEECVFDRHEVPHAMNLFDMHKKYADVLPLAEVVELLHSWRAQRDGGKGNDGNWVPSEEIMERSLS